MVRRLAGLAVVVFALVAASSFQSRPSRYVYLWAGNGTHDKMGEDVIAVIDANPSSANYAKVINVLKFVHVLNDHLVISPRGRRRRGEVSGKVTKGNRRLLSAHPDPTPAARRDGELRCDGRVAEPTMKSSASL